MFTLAPKGYVSTTSLATHLVITSQPGIIAACAGQIAPSAPSGTYYVQLIDSAAAVNGGGAITPIAQIIIPHTTTIPSTWDLSASLPLGGVSVSTGAVVQLSTTFGVGTLAGAYLNAAAAR
jgi:hypothetical protein